MAKTAGDIMTTRVVTTTPSATAAEVVALLATHHISGVPVVEEWGSIVGRKVVGIITEADLLGVPKDFRTQELMTAKPVCVGPETSLGEVAKILTDYAIKRVPVTDAEGNLLGIVSRADLVAAMAAGE